MEPKIVTTARRRLVSISHNLGVFVQLDVDHLHVAVLPEATDQLVGGLGQLF